MVGEVVACCRLNWLCVVIPFIREKNTEIRADDNSGGRQFERYMSNMARSLERDNGRDFCTKTLRMGRPGKIMKVF